MLHWRKPDRLDFLSDCEEQTLRSAASATLTGFVRQQWCSFDSLHPALGKEEEEDSARMLVPDRWSAVARRTLMVLCRVREKRGEKKGSSVRNLSVFGSQYSRLVQQPSSHSCAILCISQSENLILFFEGRTYIMQ